jgi:hypothetical protein
MDFTSRGDGLEAVFSAMQGTAKLSVNMRADNNWGRAAAAEETLQFTGSSRLVIEKQRIVGVDIENIDIDSIEQDLTGSLSLVSGRSPWLIADLESQQLNIDSLIALVPESSSDNTTDLLASLRQLGAAQAKINVKSLSLYALPLSDVVIDLSSGSDSLALNHLDFHTENGTLTSEAKINWKGDQATLEGLAELMNIDLDQFLINSEEMEHVPVSGSAKLVSEGSTMGELLSKLTGYIDLAAQDTSLGATTQARRKLALTATRLSDGMQADVTAFQWGENELTGKVRYIQTTPPQLNVEIHNGSISLLSWEEAYLKDKDTQKTESDEHAVASLVESSADFISNILLTPFRMLADENNAPRGKKLFSSEPLPLESLRDFNVEASVKLDSLISKAVSVKQLSVTGSLENAQLNIAARSEELGQGNGELALALDASTTPAALTLTSTFNNVRGLTNQDTYPRSGFISLQSQGHSEAELAAATNGLVYLELGKGPFNYANSVLLTANIAATVFQTLIPGIDRKKSELECGVAVALFQDGKGATPYGFAARTNQANLLGHVQIDLGNETLAMNLDSRGREGVGISVGSIFSNTIQIKGPLTNPSIVPDTLGLAWRSWAAMATGGLSVLGESLIKRVLASENPCKSIQNLIKKELCPTNTIAASSPLICPPN